MNTKDLANELRDRVEDAARDMWNVQLDDTEDAISVYEGYDEIEARKVFDAYVGSNTPVSLERNAEIVVQHRDGVVKKVEKL